MVWQENTRVIVCFTNNNEANSVCFYSIILILENKCTLKGEHYVYALLSDKLVQTFTLCLDLII